jgi:hypothetical protein
MVFEENDLALRVVGVGYLSPVQAHFIENVPHRFAST